MSKPLITFDDFMSMESKIEIRIGVITHAERVPKSNGLKLVVAFGPFNDDCITKTAFTNLGKTYEPEQLIGVKAPFVMNLEPSEIKGVISQVMILPGIKQDGSMEFEDFTSGTKLM